MITQEELKEFFSYDSGKLIRNSDSEDISRNHKKGYLVIQFQNKPYLLHQLIWFYFYGYFADQLDHVDMDKSNNRIENLRECTHSQQHANKTKYKNNTSGYKGVQWCSTTNKWRAVLMKDRKGMHLGRFPTKEQAASCYDWHATKIWGEFARTNGAVFILE